MAKDTVLWFCFTAFVMVMRFSTSRENENVAKTIIADTIKITILLEFLVGRFSFSLPVELLLVPFVSLVVLLDAFSRLDEQHADVAKLTNWTLTTTGFVILGFAAWSAICDWRDLGAIETVRSIAFPPLMSLLFIPFVYSLLVVASYESLFVRLQLGKDKAPDVVLYAKRRIFLNCQLSLSRLRKLTQRPPNELMQVESTADVDLALARTSLVKTESATDV